MNTIIQKNKVSFLNLYKNVFFQFLNKTLLLIIIPTTMLFLYKFIYGIMIFFLDKLLFLITILLFKIFIDIMFYFANTLKQFSIEDLYHKRSILAKSVICIVSLTSLLFCAMLYEKNAGIYGLFLIIIMNLLLFLIFLMIVNLNLYDEMHFRNECDILNKSKIHPDFIMLIIIFLFSPTILSLIMFLIHLTIKIKIPLLRYYNFYNHLVYKTEFF